MALKDWSSKGISRTSLTVLIGSMWLRCIPAVQADGLIYRISKSQFPCNDIETLAGSAMLLRLAGVTLRQANAATDESRDIDERFRRSGTVIIQDGAC